MATKASRNPCRRTSSLAAVAALSAFDFVKSLSLTWSRVGCGFREREKVCLCSSRFATLGVLRFNPRFYIAAATDNMSLQKAQLLENSLAAEFLLDWKGYKSDCRVTYIVQCKGVNHPRMSLWKDDIGGESADNLLRDDTSEDWVSGFDRFRASLIRFLGQLNSLSSSSVKIYTELRQAIQDSKSNHHRWSSQPQNGNLNSQSQDGNLNSESQEDQSR